MDEVSAGSNDPRRSSHFCDFRTTSQREQTLSSHLPDRLPAHPPVPPAAFDSERPPARIALGLGVSAVVLGCFAGAFIWIPFCGLGGFPIAGLGLILAGPGMIVALTSGGRQRPAGPAIGAGFCIVAIMVGWVSIKARQESPEVIAQRNAQYLIQQQQRDAQEAKRRLTALPDDSWSVRPEGLPEFTVLSDRFSHAGFKNSAYRNTEIQASGDVTEADLVKILDYAARQRSIPEAIISISAVDKRPGGRGYALALRSPQGNRCAAPGDCADNFALDSPRE